MLTMPDNRRIDPSWLPITPLSQMEFLDSSFFQLHGPNQRLPAPAEVTALSGAGLMHSRPPPVRFESLGLIVKFGYHVTIYEAQCQKSMAGEFTIIRYSSTCSLSKDK